MLSMRVVVTTTSGTSSPWMSAMSGATTTSLVVHDHSSWTSTLSKVGLSTHDRPSGCGRHLPRTGSQ